MQPDNTRERFIQIASEHLGHDPARLTDDASFIEDLGADSLDLIELTMEAEEAFEIRIDDDDAFKAKTVGQAITLIRRERSDQAPR